MDFLLGLDPRPVVLKELGLDEGRLHLGQGDAALEVVVAELDNPRPDQVRKAWKARHGGRVSPVLLTIVNRKGCTLCGPTSEEQIWSTPSVDAADRLCRAALGEPNRHAAIRLLSSALPEIESPTPGLRNQGLFATHQLRVGLPQMPEWKKAGAQSQKIQTLRDHKLVESLGFEIQALEGPASLLRTKGGAQLGVAVFLDRTESAELSLARFGGLSPILYALHHADLHQVKHVLVSTGGGLRLYSTDPGAGVGHRGRTETFAEIRLDLLKPEHAAYLWLLFSADALSDTGTVSQILDASRRFASELGGRLRDRVYERVIPLLAQAVMKAKGKRTPKGRDLDDAYKITLTVLFRLLFVAYAEDLDLLPFRTNDAYRSRSLKIKARELLKSGETSTAWREIALMFEAIDKGRREWGVPPYDGGLFSVDPEISPVGSEIARLQLPEDLFSQAFRALMIDEGPDGPGPVDFRSLGVRDFGTIYEGLLENELEIAETDLALGKESRYREAKRGEKPVVRTGEAYLRNRSGQRKSTGTYYTKRFAVDHLLNKALEPALDDHLARLDGLEERDASKSFFDFRVADIAMGSGHFLVAAVDRIERKLSGYLAKRPLGGVREELKRLRSAAYEALGETGKAIEIEDAQLLRRQIARRCVYGVDLNPEAIDLARLSIWIHTFVPGLPLSVLDRNFVPGNSLVGIGTEEEVWELLDLKAVPLLRDHIDSIIAKACEPLKELADLSEADAAEIKQARKRVAAARKTVEPAAALFDILTAGRQDESLLGKAQLAASEGVKELLKLSGSKLHMEGLRYLSPLAPFHFPLAFPEVFLRKRAGFDVIVGNPPWEEATVEEDTFWTRFHPRLQGLPQHEVERIKRRLREEHPDEVEVFEREKASAEALRKALTHGAYPGMGKGDPDTYKAFCWRFWNLIARDGGRFAVVLPRSALAASGSAEWRRKLLAAGRVEDVTSGLNRAGWMFDDAEHRYTISLLTITSTRPEGEVQIPLRGPYTSLEEFLRGVAKPATPVALKAIEAASDELSFPLFPSDESIDVWLQMRKFPRLDLDQKDSWRAKPYAELHATNDKPMMKLSKDQPKDFWPIFKGESFDIWTNDTGSYYGWGDPGRICPILQDRRQASIARKGSALVDFELDWALNKDTLPCLHPRIAFRDVSRATDSRTVRTALLPPKVFITNTAPYLLWPRGDEKDQAYLLGVLASIPLDWYGRRYVETHVNYFVFNPFPIPRPARTDTLWKRVVEIAGRLGAQDRRLAGWAAKVRVECGPVRPDKKADMEAELDAIVARLYGLSEVQLHHIFETFHEGWDYEERLGRVLEYFRKIAT